MNFTVKQTMNKSFKDIQMLKYRMNLLQGENKKTNYSVQKLRERTNQMYKVKQVAHHMRVEKKKFLKNDDESIEI